MVSGPLAAEVTATDGYSGHFIGKIMPTPQEVSYETGTWELADAAASTALACVNVPLVPTRAEQAAAQEVVARIRRLSGGVDVPLIRGETASPPRACVITIRNPAGDRLMGRMPSGDELAVPDRPEAYVIACLEGASGQRRVMVAGSDEAGVFFGAVALVQMMERVGDRVVLHPVQVRDWPTYRLRSFKTGGAYDPGGSPEQMGRWAPYARFNCYNICYTTLGQDKWVSPDPGYRELVARCARYMSERGLDCMPFVNPYYLWKEHIEVSDYSDLARLAATCSLGPQWGAHRVMLCLDDFASEPNWAGPALYHVRSERDRARWGDDLAAVNVALINHVHRRLTTSYPNCQLYVVLPYYWNPTGKYTEAGEAYLRAVGQGVNPEVRLVWTGPVVRSAVISEADLSYYQGLLGGRKVMLWDNTLYMHHNPPHYFLDSFRTRYPSRFWELMSGEVHLNAGGGEAYKCGLLAAADYLWNPEAYDPDRALRDAVAIIAGPDCVDDLLAFRDAFYTIYDTYAPTLGKPAEFFQRVTQMTASPFDEAGLHEMQAPLRREVELADKLAVTCDNPALVAEVRERLQMHAPYRSAFELLAALPPMSDSEATNIAPNPGAEEVDGNRPAQWSTYSGAGHCTLTLTEGHTGRHAAKLTATAQHDWGDGRKSINVALMIGDTNGYEGPRAPQVQPLHQYYFSFWLKGTAPRVVVSFVTWDDTGSRESRGGPAALLAPFAAPAEWTRYSGRLITPATAARGALKIAIEGFDSEGGGLGEICVDDVYVGRSKAHSEGETGS